MPILGSASHVLKYVSGLIVLDTLRLVHLFFDIPLIASVVSNSKFYSLIIPQYTRLGLVS